jgi:hypothetical protein
MRRLISLGLEAELRMRLALAMKSYDDIRSMLEAELEEAMTRHEGETLHRHHTGAALAEAIDRYRRFTNHGIIPEDIAEDEGDL